jgi:hypothetical protein
MGMQFRKDARRLEANERQEARDKRGDAKQLAQQEASGFGEGKEATRLRAQIEKAKKKAKHGNEKKETSEGDGKGE